MTEKTLRETITDAYNASEAEDDGALEAAAEGSEPEEVEEELEAEAEEELEVEASTEGPSRDRSGRFLSKDRNAKPAPAKSGAPKAAAQATAKPDGAAPAASTTAVESAPTSFAADARTAWSSTPPAVRAAVIKREQEITNGFRDKDAQIARLSDIDRAVAPHSQMFTSRNMSAAQGISALLAWSRALDGDPRTALSKLASNYGFDVSFAQKQNGGTTTTAPAASEGTQDPLNDRLSNLENVIRTERQQRQAEVVRQAQAAAEEYAKDKPYFDELKPTMVQLLRGGMAKDLPEAYEKACKLDPTVAAKIATDAESARLAQRTVGTSAAASRKPAPTVNRQKTAARASLRTGSPQGNVSGGNSGQKSLRDTLTDAWGKHAGQA